MDLQKILSRGTKKTSKPLPQSKPSPKPSNPQLYNDSVHGLKRKRTDDPSSLTPEHDDGPSFDFFGPREPQKPLQKPREPVKLAEQTSTPELSHDEVQQILRSHRLKFTLLSHNTGASKVKKSKTKKQEATKSKGKEARKQLFPKPLTSFSQLRSTYNVSARLVENLAREGYRIPTEVQLGSLPLMLQPEKALPTDTPEGLDLGTHDGVNFLAVAPTGSGKTLAFMIPTINSIMRRRAREKVQKAEHVLEAIIIAPTKELAHQIVNEGRKLAQGTGVKIAGMKKGMRIPAEGLEEDDTTDEEGSESDASSSSASGEEKDEPRQRAPGAVTKADVLVTTPLLLRNFLKSRTLPTVRCLVLDEGDVLLDPLFRDQVMDIWAACTNEHLRFTIWSATMGANVEDLVLEQLQAKGSSHPPAPLVRLVVGLKDTAVPSINHKLIYTATEQGKLFTLRQILHPRSSDNPVPNLRLPILVFTQTIERATALHSELKFDIPVEAGGSSRIEALHSSLSDSARSRIVARFRAGEIWVLITTDLLMRGVDFRGVNGVINYDLPTSAAAYVHRVGRTGRAGREGGIAVTLYTTEDVAHLKSIANVIALSEKQAGREKEEGLPKWLIESLPKVGKEEKKKLRKRGVESRRGDKATITSKSAWERRKEHNRRGAIVGSKRRKAQEVDGDGNGDDTRDGGDSEWGGIED
ncbi:P-loop containing nucleoside triphosphate hydrolase protein [Xylariomycetidae sp. FL2044]|nr:P-loop containing nucleoside triphosphate hydrolase protein [Xylariomycetidae sp. FL2044]